MPDQLAEELRIYSQSLPLILELGMDRLRRIAALTVTTAISTSQTTATPVAAASIDAFHRAFTTVNLGGQNDLDSASIDADLARNLD